MPFRRRGNNDAVLPTIASIVVIALSGAVARAGIVATAGGRDQRLFHLPSVNYLLSNFPDVDLAQLHTATGPLYHMVVATIAGILGLNPIGIQIVGSFFSSAVAGLSFWYGRSIDPVYLRAISVSPLLLSPYFWQSALWMLTDNAAILFTFAAFAITLSNPHGFKPLTLGFIVACAIATRQSYVWIYVPILAVYFYHNHRSPLSEKLAAILKIVSPGLLTLGGLILIWHGLTPPTVRGNATALSPVAISFTAVIAALFAIPVLLSLERTKLRTGELNVAIAVGLAMAIPAIVFPSNPTTSNDHRRGGLVWSLANHLPVVHERSLFIAFSAFIGGVSCTLLIRELRHCYRIFLFSALASMSIAFSTVTQLYQKYFELPIALLFTLIIVSLARNGQIRHRWPLILLSGWQAVCTFAVVLIPIMHWNFSTP